MYRIHDADLQQVSHASAPTVLHDNPQGLRHPEAPQVANNIGVVTVRQKLDLKTDIQTPIAAATTAAESAQNRNV